MIYLYVISTLILIYLVYPQTINYAKYNDVLLKQANNNYEKIKRDVDELFTTFKTLPPGRIFAGRGGWWGRDFRVAETPYYMHLSTYGLPTVLWLPETWSMNSDTEQYFSEDALRDYNLYNVRYVAAPPKQEPQIFWKLIKESPSWKLYEVATGGYFTGGVRPTIVSSPKENLLNLVHLWIQSDYSQQGLFPMLTFDNNYPRNVGLPNFKMLDEVTYQTPDSKIHNLFAEKPLYLAPDNSTANQTGLKILGPETVESDMIFKTKVEVKGDCEQCLVILKQTFHPAWRATIDGKPVKPMLVFPFFTAVSVSEPGVHEIIFSYEPSGLKQLLLFLEIMALSVIFLAWINRAKKSFIW